MSIGIAHRHNYSVSSDAGGSLSGAQAEVGTTELTIDQTYGASLTDQLLTIAFNYADVQSVILVSDKGLTIETNSGSSPSNTFVLKAATPLVWSKSAAYFANPFTANVTAFYITTTAAARLQGKILKV